MAGESTHGEKGHSGGMSMYVRFMAMIGTSTAVMFGLMYLNTYSIDHVFWSETRFWMAFVMGAAMMVVMLAFMWGMYKDRTKNFIILGMADRKSTRLNSSHQCASRMPSYA